MASENKDEKKIIFYFDHTIKDKFTFIEEDQKNEGTSKTSKGKTVTTTENVFIPGEIVARIITPDDPRYHDSNFNYEFLRSDFIQKDTQNVVFNSQTKEYVAVIYGFAKLLNQTQIVIEPLTEYSKDKMKAWIYVCRTGSRNWLDMKHIKSIYEKEKIVFPLEDTQIKPKLEKLKDESKSGKRLLIAAGTKPKPGKPERIKLKKEMTLKIGKMDESGRIDYKEKDSFIIVNQGEVLAEVLPEEPPENGIDVFGNDIQAKTEGGSPYRIGLNVSRDPDDPKLVIADIDGILEIDEDGKIHVENKLTIESNVNLETGNVHFPGAVEIKGTVESGFLVEAEGNVFIEDNVEDAKVISGGNVIVQNGIMGKEHVKIEAEGTIRCKFTQNAELKAGKEIHIDESAIQTRAFAKEKINIIGSVIGGDLTARESLIVNNAGSTSGVKTHLTAGRDPEIEAKVEELNKQFSKDSKRLKEIIDELTQYFGEDFIKKIKSILPTLPKHRKITALKLVKEMSQVNNTLTKIKAEREKLKNQLHFDKPPFIRVTNEVYPEVYIRVRTSIKKIEKELFKVTFKEDPEKKVIYWEQN